MEGEDVHRLTIDAKPCQFGGITLHMLCPEYNRLRQLYEAALRRWTHIELSSHGRELSDASARLAAEIKQNALDETNAAMERMRLHVRSCQICKRKPSESG